MPRKFGFIEKAFQVIFFITECFLFCYTPFSGILRSSWTFYLGGFLASPELTVQLWRTNLVRHSLTAYSGAPIWCAIVGQSTQAKPKKLPSKKSN